jgi:hypothetical protein
VLWDTPPTAASDAATKASNAVFIPKRGAIKTIRVTKKAPVNVVDTVERKPKTDL